MNIQFTVPSRRKLYHSHVHLVDSSFCASTRAFSCTSARILRYINCGISIHMSRGNVSVFSGQISESKGLVSIDRSEAAALLSTTPRLRPRSSTNDFAPLRSMGLISFRHSPAPLRGREEPLCCGLFATGAEVGRPAAIFASQRRGANGIVTFLGGILT